MIVAGYSRKVDLFHEYRHYVETLRRCWRRRDGVGNAEIGVGDAEMGVREVETGIGEFEMVLVVSLRV